MKANHKITLRQLDKILELRKKGITLREIAKLFDLSRQGVSDLLKKYECKKVGNNK